MAEAFFMILVAAVCVAAVAGLVWFLDRKTKSEREAEERERASRQAIAFVAAMAAIQSGSRLKISHVLSYYGNDVDKETHQKLVDALTDTVVH